MSTGEELRQRLRAVQEDIRAAALAAQRDPASVRLIAVTKTVPVEQVAEAYACGLREFGENRAQELAAKAAVLPPDAAWHMIGHLQQNKVRTAVRGAAWIHSVDSADLVTRCGRIAAEEGRRVAILLQVNLTGEPSKSGLTPEATRPALEEALRCPGLACRGLMAMTRFGADTAELRHTFGGLRQLRDDLAARLGTELPELSMGMSGDFTEAIREGATMVRLGTALFGVRP